MNMYNQVAMKKATTVQSERKQMSAIHAPLEKAHLTFNGTDRPTDEKKYRRTRLLLYISLQARDVDGKVET